ncbi:MAG: DMT family transporter [Lysobacterales bacterium]
MPKPTVCIATLLAMLGFAANSILCRVALERTAIDPASFTMLRLIAGAVMLWILVSLRGGEPRLTGNWPSALALFAYAAGFSFAYVSLSTATGALLLFGAVQVTMLAGGVRAGERFSRPQVLGYLLALAGLTGLLMPGVAAPPFLAAGLMLGAGVAWGIYSLRGKGQCDAIRATAGNFLRTVPIALLLLIAMPGKTSFDNTGVWLAIASGALASGIGYTIWYSVLPVLRATTAATVQLSVPLIAALGGAAFLSEPLTLRWLLASFAILGGIALVTLRNAPDRA